MSLSFPTSPTVGQIYQGWMWTGSAWAPAAQQSGLPGMLGFQVFTSNGTYTPTAGMAACMVECIGGGAGGNGSPGAGGAYFMLGGGGSGGYSRKYLTAAQVGASQAITVGGGGAGGVSTALAALSYGQAGVDTSFGALCIAHGAPAVGTGTPTLGLLFSPGLGAPTGVGDLVAHGNGGGTGGQVTSGSGYPPGGYGGPSAFGGSASPISSFTSNNSVAGSNYGAGGSGASQFSTGAMAGGNGAPGIVLVWEFSAGQGAQGPAGPAGPAGGWSTGDVKLTYKTVADTGFLMMNDQTIGAAASGATYANAAAQALFTLLYNNTTDANCPILTSAGAATTRSAQGTAATAWAAAVRLSLPLALGRDLAVGGSGAGLSTWALGQNEGAETHVQAAGEVVDHYHTTTYRYYSPDINQSFATPSGAVGYGFGSAVSHVSTGYGTAMNILNPRTHLNVMICL